MHAPIITITTDFGTRDPWVGIMKGVMLGICPGAQLVDLGHDIAPQDVLGGALCLEAAVRFFPPGTIHLAVVDPGVGSSRRGVAAQAGGQYFVGPDNGRLSLAVALAGGPAGRLWPPSAPTAPIVSSRSAARSMDAISSRPRRPTWRRGCRSLASARP